MWHFLAIFLARKLDRNYTDDIDRHHWGGLAAFLFLPWCLTVFYYAALLPRRGPHIASHSVCLSVRPSRYRYTERHIAPPSELQWHTCTFRHALRAAYRTAISAAQILVFKLNWCYKFPKIPELQKLQNTPTGALSTRSRKHLFFRLKSTYISEKAGPQ